VEPFDVAEDAPARFSVGCIVALVDALDLQRVEEALQDGIVQQLPLRLVLQVMPATFGRAWYSSVAYWLP